ncbi:MAG: hypothetical protein ACJ798_03225 [Phenylobacterium sp.]
MQVGVNQSYVLGLFGSTSGSSSLDLTSLAVSASLPVSSTSTQSQPVAPTPPWTHTETPAQATDAVRSALAGHDLINEGAAKLDLPGASDDYKKLFALYQGLSTLADLATRAQAKNLAPVDQAQLAKAFAKGLAEVSAYADTSDFSKLRLAVGTDTASATSKLPVTRAATSYVTPPLANNITAEVPAFTGAVQFNISIKRVSTTFNVAIDLAGMGAQARTLPNVINYINGQLAATGVETRLGSSRIPGVAQTIQVNGKPVTLPAPPDQYALKVNVGTAETVTFSAPATANAVYLAQTVGDPDPDHTPSTNDGKTQTQLLKFQTDTTAVAAPTQTPGQPNWVDGRVFAANLDPDIKTVRATQVGADGSVYMLADVTGAVNGQAIERTQDVALLKYDSAGHLTYTRTLGASDQASGLSLAVAADGKVAIAGSLTGALNGSVDGALNSGASGSFAASTDSFVTLYDAQGQEAWTERRGTRLNDEVDQMTFGADGTLYVAGRAQGQMPGADAGAPIGGYDGYLEAFTTDPAGKPSVAFTQSYGTAGQDKPKGLVVSGTNLYTASVEDGHAVVRSFDISSGAPVLAATRDLGDLQGGDITGLGLNGGNLIVAGSTANGALSAGAVTRAASGGVDAFAAQISADLTNQPGDAIAYYGGSGDDRATAMSVAGGQVFIAGAAGTDLPGQPVVGSKDGFLAQLDIATGAIAWSRRFTGQANMAAPTSIAVAPTGASVLDRLGLPTGTLQLADSQQLIAQSSLRAGEQFTIKTGSAGLARTITIDAGETFDTLAKKIQRATGFEVQAKVTTGLDGARQLRITPVYSQITFELGAGPQGKDALSTLGLSEGMVNLTQLKNGVTSPADGGAKIYGLGLSSSLNLSNASQISHALASVSSALGVIRQVYRDLVAAATPKSALAAAQAAGKVGEAPAYLKAQVANYQAGLARLLGGGGSSGGLF